MWLTSEQTYTGLYCNFYLQHFLTTEASLSSLWCCALFEAFVASWLKAGLTWERAMRKADTQTEEAICSRERTHSYSMCLLTWGAHALKMMYVSKSGIVSLFLIIIKRIHISRGVRVKDSHVMRQWINNTNEEHKEKCAGKRLKIYNKRLLPGMFVFWVAARLNCA